MLYTEKEKHEIERVKEVFAEHLRQSPDFELLWSDKVGYVWLTIGVNPVYVDTGIRIESAADLCCKCLDDVAMELSQIAADDTFVDSWSDHTKNRFVSSYLTFIAQAGLFDRKSFELHKAIGVTDNEYAYYVQIGQEWFLEACLLHP